MMSIDNNLQIVSQAPVYHFLDTCQPNLVDTHGSSIRNVTLPTNGDTYCIKSGFLYSFDGFLGDNGIAP